MSCHIMGKNNGNGQDVRRLLKALKHALDDKTIKSIWDKIKLFAGYGFKNFTDLRHAFWTLPT